jgi:hypothetical protein
MLQERLLKEVAVPLWYATKNLAKIAVSEEALLIYVSIIFTAVCFAIECWDSGCTAVKWSIGAMIGVCEQPEICEMYVDENLYLMPAHDDSEILSTEVEKVISWWKTVASEVFGGEVVDGEFWSEGLPLQLEGAGSLLCLPPCRKPVKKAKK